MRTDRDRQAEALDDLDGLPDDQQDGSAAVLLITKTCTVYPTAAGQVYCCNPVLIDCDDVEGASPSFAVDTTVLFFALNLGTAIPPAGTYLIGSHVGGRLAFAYNG